MHSSIWKNLKATLGVLGSGGEGSTHVRAINAVRRLSKLTVFSPTEANRNAFAKAFEVKTDEPSVAVATEEEAEETGYFRDAHAAGVEFDHKVFTLNQLVLGELSEKMVGAPLQDIAVATIAYQRALEADLASDSGVHFARKG